MAEEFDFHPMWESLGMNLADHDMLLGAVGQMYGDMFLTQNNRPKSTSYLDFVATNIHSGRIKEMLDKKEAGEATKIVGSFCVYVPEEIVLACDGIPVGLCSGADWRPTRSRSICRATPVRLSRALPALSWARSAPTSSRATW